MTRAAAFGTITFFLLLACVSLALAGGHAEIGTAVHAAIHPRECRFARMDGRKGFSDNEIRETIRCDVRRWPVPGGVSQALSVAACESGFETRTGGSYLGVYQFAPATWASNRSRFRQLGRRWDLSWSGLNGRANVTVALKMAHAGGWGPWSCA